MNTAVMEAMLDTYEDWSDVAHVLGRLPRFNGRVPFYPVLAHSLVVGEQMAYALPPKNHWQALFGFIHDVGEAFHGDIPQPFKEPANTLNEKKMRDNLLQKFDLPFWHHRHVPRSLVKWADRLAAAAEWDLLGPVHEPCLKWQETLEEARQGYTYTMQRTRFYASVPVEFWFSNRHSDTPGGPDAWALQVNTYAEAYRRFRDNEETPRTTRTQ